MHSTFLQILLIFSSPKGHQLQFSIPRAYFVYTVWQCTGQHCSSMYACTYHLFASMFCPLVSVDPLADLFFLIGWLTHRNGWLADLNG